MRKITQCGHCQKLQPEWDQLPSKIGKRVKIAKIDATVNRQMGQKYGIKGFPTLLLFGAEDSTEPIKYEGQRTAEDMVSWVQSQKIP
jgi:protein disulfide-isomerase A6